MSKTVKEKAKEWGCSGSTVTKYCSSGIIPPATKEGRPAKWQIPDEWPKPPMSRHGLCFLLDTIYQLNHGVIYENLKMGYALDEVREGYKYLISSAFMSFVDVNDLKSSLSGATVTPRGAALIEKENIESKGKMNFKAHGTIKTTIGVASAEVGAEVSNG